MRKKSILRRLAVVLSATIVGGMLFTGCGKSGDGDVETNSSKSDKLIIYSNSVSDGRGEWLKEKAAEAGFNIEYVDAGGGELENRLIAEKNNPIADIVFGLNTMTFEKFKQHDLLEQFVPTWAGEITEGLNDKDGYYHSLVKQAILLIYNSDLYNEETAPKDWIDLWTKEEYYGKYEVPTKLSAGTTRVVLSGILTRYVDPNGELGISEEGWNQIKAYFANGSRAVEGEDFYANLASGKTPMGQMWSSGIVSREEQYGVKAGMVNPSVGVPYVVEQIGIVKGSKKVETAKEFINWFGTADIQGQWAEEFSTMPANENAMDKASDANKFLSENYKVQDIDWTFVTENIDEWMEKIELEYLK